MKQFLFNIKSFDDKTFFWKSYDEKRQLSETKNLKKFQEAFRKEQKRLRELFESQNIIDEQIIAQEINASMGDWERAFIEAATESTRSITETFPNDSSEFRTILQERTDSLISRTIATKITRMQEFSKKIIGTVILNKRKEGVTISEIQSAIMKKYESWISGTPEQKASRALTIARTETGTIGSYSQFNAGVLSGFTRKIWITSRDELVRGTKLSDPANHRILEGQERGIREIFQNGLMMPLDPTATNPSEVINCRCALSFS